MNIINHPRQAEGRERIQQNMAALNRLTCYVHHCAQKAGASEFYTFSVMQYAREDLARGKSLAYIKPRVHKAFRCADEMHREVRHGG